MANRFFRAITPPLKNSGLATQDYGWIAAFHYATIIIEHATSILQTLCPYHCHATPTPGHEQVGIGGNLQELFDKFPTLGDDFMLQISEGFQEYWTNTPTLRTNCYKYLPITRRRVGNEAGGD